MIEKTIQREINLLNNGIQWFTLSLHKQKEKGKLMIIDHFTGLYTSLMVAKMSEIERWLNNVILHAQNEWYNIDNLLLYLKK